MSRTNADTSPGTYSVKWAGGTNFVTGLGWSRGGPRYTHLLSNVPVLPILISQLELLNTLVLTALLTAALSSARTVGLKTP